MTKIRFRIIFVFLFVSSCCIYAQDWPFVETSLKYNDTTVIPFENQLYFKNQIDDNKCLSLIDFKKYHPMGAKKYVELFRVIEDVDSRPVCFEIGMIDRSHADIVLRYPNKQLAAGMCSENENITISVKTYKNIDLNNEKFICKMMRCIKLIKKSSPEQTSTSIIDIEYLDFMKHYYFSYRVWGNDHPDAFYTINQDMFCFINLRQADFPSWLIDWLKKRVQVLR